MSKEEVINKINDIIVEEFEVDKEKIKPEAPLMETLELDSLDLVDLVVLIEKNFGFKVKGEDFIELKTIQNFYDYILVKINI